MSATHCGVGWSNTTHKMLCYQWIKPRNSQLLAKEVCKPKWSGKCTYEIVMCDIGDVKMACRTDYLSIPRCSAAYKFRNTILISHDTYFCSCKPDGVCSKACIYNVRKCV